jgi:hypothetical protein
MSIPVQSKESLLFVIDELAKETKLAQDAPFHTVKKHIARIAVLQQKFNTLIARAVCYGK